MIVCFGDSLVNGFIDGSDYVPFGSIVRSELKVPTQIKGFDGGSLLWSAEQPYLCTEIALTLETDVKFVFVWAGANDMAHNVDTVWNKLKIVYDYILESLPRCRLIAMTLPQIDCNRRNLRTFNDRIRAYVWDNSDQALLLDTADLQVGTDRLHLKEEGYERVGMRAVRLLRPLLRPTESRSES